MGHARAFEFLVMARPLSAAAAQAAGLVNTMVAADKLQAAAREAAHAIAALPPEAVPTARRMMRGAPEELLAQVSEEAEMSRERLTSAKARATFVSFLSRKR